MPSGSKTPPTRLGTAISVKIQAQWPHLSDKERRVAEFLLADPKEFISLSISAVADRCEVSETVILRLYRKLGYGGFHEFKISIASTLAQGGGDGLGALQAGDDMEIIKRKVIAVTRQSLEDNLTSLDVESLEKARDAILKARRIVIAAFGGSAAVGLDLTHKLLKLGIVATFQPDSHMQAMSAAVLERGDLFIGISHSGNSRDVIEGLEYAKGRGARTLAITGFPFSPAAKVAEITLYTLCRETQYQTDSMTSRIVQLALIDTLYVAMMFSLKDKGLATIRETSLGAAKKKL